MNRRRSEVPGPRSRKVPRESSVQPVGDDRFRLLVEAISDYAVFMLDSDGHITSWNAGAERITGYRGTEVLGRHYELLYPADAGDAGAPQRELQGASADGQLETEGWRVRKDGTRFWASVGLSAMRDARGRLEGFANVTADLTERRRVEDALRQSDERYRLLFAVNPVPAWVFDMETLRFVAVNDAAVAKYGYTREEFLGMTILDIRPPEDVPALRAAISRIAMGRAGGGTWRHCTKGGDVIDVDITSHVLTFAGRPAELVLAHDVTVRRKLEQTLRAGEEQARRNEETVRRYAAELETANAELDAFAYSVSHDLRAPLRSIDGFSQVVLEDSADTLDEAGRDALRRVRAASRRMSDLIDDLLTLARVTRHEMQREAVELSALAGSVLAEWQQREPGRHVDVVVAPGLVVQGDPRLLRVALENLLANAWKYTGKRAEARIELGTLERDGARIFYVRDNGAGFDMQYADRLFGAFQRLHGDAEFEGSGIGLATVQRILRRHGGRIWADGAVEQGATFYFTLEPRTDPP
ncbi:MAG: sensor histidine kinase [Gemmatimonadales bacterium]